MQLPPTLSETFQARSARPEKVGKIISELSNLLTKDMKDLEIYMSSNTITLRMKRIKVNLEKLYSMKKIGRKLLEIGEEFEV